MEIIKIVLIVIAIINTVGLLFFSFYSRKPLKLIFLNSLSGIAFLILTTAFGKFLNVYIYFNAYTLALSAFSGIPGVIILILINMFL